MNAEYQSKIGYLAGNLHDGTLLKIEIDLERRNLVLIVEFCRLDNDVLQEAVITFSNVTRVKFDLNEEMSVETSEIHKIELYEMGHMKLIGEPGWVLEFVAMSIDVDLRSPGLELPGGQS